MATVVVRSQKYFLLESLNFIIYVKHFILYTLNSVSTRNSCKYKNMVLKSTKWSDCSVDKHDVFEYSIVYTYNDG